MSMQADQVVQVLLRERLRIAVVATAIVRDVHSADDIFQQVVLRGLENPAQFCDADHLLAWAIRAARHRAIDVTRRRRLVCLPDEILDLLEARWAGLSPSEWSDQLEALHHCVGQLGTPSRNLLQMKYSDGLTASVIAGRLGRSLNAVYQSLSRIHRSLRDCATKELSRLEHAAGRAAT
jgi:RNA polymerase sigma-70 factor (ECF subfamily)